MLWLAQRHGVPLRLPRQHPFNPLPLLRALVAAGEPGVSPTRDAVALAFRYVWQHGQLPHEPAFADLLRSLGVQAEALDTDEVKAELRANTEAAIADDAFGVPTAVVRIGAGQPHRFWGLDALPMMMDCINGHAVFSSEDMTRATALPVGLQRKAVAR